MARRNLSTNPSLEINTTGHAVVFTRSGITVGAVSRSNTIAAQSGTFYGFVNVTGAASSTSSDFDIGFPTATVVAGQQYTASAYLRHSVTGVEANVVIEWRTAAGVLIGSESQGGYNAVSSTAWGRHTVTATAPATAAQARAVVWVFGVTDTASRSFRWDAVLVEQAATAGSYFDGDSSGAVWDGTAHASTSTIPDPVTVTDRPARAGARGAVETVIAGTATADRPTAVTGTGPVETVAVGVIRADTPAAVRGGGAVDVAVLGATTATDPTQGAARARDVSDMVPVSVVDTPTAVRGVGPVETVTAGGPVVVADTPAAVRGAGAVETVAAERNRVAALDVAVREPAPRWELLVAETRTGTVLAELPFTDLTWNTPLNDIGTLTATIPIEAHVAWLSDDRSPVNRLRTVLSGEWRFSLCAVFGTTPIIAGPLITSTPVTGDANVTVGCAELGALLKRRRVRTPGTDPAALGADLALGPTSLPQLARLLLEKATDPANGPGWDLPLILPDLDTKGDHVRTYLGSDLADVWTRLSDLTEVENGPDLRFEPELTDVTGGRKLWWRVRIGEPWLGTWIDGENPPRPPWIFDLGAGLKDLTTDRDASAMTMRTFVPGQARTEPAATTSSTDTTAPQDAPKPIGSAADLTLINAGYPVLEDVDGSHTSATEQATLDAWAVAGVAANRTPVEAWNVTVDGASTPRLGQWRVGDTGTFVTYGQDFVEDGEHERRIVGASGNAGTDVTLVLTPVPAAV